MIYNINTKDVTYIYLYIFQNFLTGCRLFANIKILAGLLNDKILIDFYKYHGLRFWNYRLQKKLRIFNYKKGRFFQLMQCFQQNLA